jgi:hypothetical protein
LKRASRVVAARVSNDLQVWAELAELSNEVGLFDERVHGDVAVARARPQGLAPLIRHSEGVSFPERAQRRGDPTELCLQGTYLGREGTARENQSELPEREGERLRELRRGDGAARLNVDGMWRQAAALIVGRDVEGERMG